jgi:hypothetical protein
MFLSRVLCRVSTKVVFYFRGNRNSDERHHNFVENSMFRYLPKFRFRCRNRPVSIVYFDEIEILTKFHTDFVEISMYKSEFQFRFRCRNRYFDFGSVFDIGIPILI